MVKILQPVRFFIFTNNYLSSIIRNAVYCPLRRDEKLAMVNLNASHLCCVLLQCSVFEIKSKLCENIPKMQIKFYVYNPSFLNYCKEIITYYFLIKVRKVTYSVIFSDIAG